MPRAVAAIAIVVAAVLAARATFGTPAQRAYACSLVPQTTDEIIRKATIVLIGDAVSVGGPDNGAPTLTPTSTPPPFESPTASATASTRSRGGRSPTPTARATTTPPPTRTPDPYRRLDGMSATFAPVEVIDGAAVGPITVDAARRARYERELRAIEAGQYPICGPFGAPRFTSGARYLLFAAATTEGFETVYRARVIGDEVVLGDASIPDNDWANISVTKAAYQRYFAGVPVEPNYGGDTHEYINRGRVPLAAFLRFARDARSGVIILPPDTGSAGLAAGR